jgi:hypothetical protein
MTLSHWKSVTPEEQEFGFAEAETGSGIRVIFELGHGLVAVKIRTREETTEYAICNTALQPLYANAVTLQDLRRRFSRR